MNIKLVFSLVLTIALSVAHAMDEASMDEMLNSVPRFPHLIESTRLRNTGPLTEPPHHRLASLPRHRRHRRPIRLAYPSCMANASQSLGQCPAWPKRLRQYLQLARRSARLGSELFYFDDDRDERGPVSVRNIHHRHQWKSTSGNTRSDKSYFCLVLWLGLVVLVASNSIRTIMFDVEAAKKNCLSEIILFEQDYRSCILAEEQSRASTLALKEALSRHPLYAPPSLPFGRKKKLK